VPYNCFSKKCFQDVRLACLPSCQLLHFSFIVTVYSPSVSSPTSCRFEAHPIFSPRPKFYRCGQGNAIEHHRRAQIEPRLLGTENMHISHILPLSLSLVSGALAQLAGNQPAPRPAPAISINVGGQGNAAARQSGVAPAPVGQQQPQQQPGAAGPAPAAVTIKPGGAGNQGQAGAAIPQQPQAGAAPGQVPALGQQSGAAVPVWVVKVGSEKNDLVFSPNTFNAKPGEFVQFQFYSRVSGIWKRTVMQ
jgi:hypothetical protein